MTKSACPMIARSDWGVGSIHQKGISHTSSIGQSTIGFHGPRTAGWLVFMNGAHRGEDMRVPVGEAKIGSSWNADLVLTGVGVGSQHATVRMGMDEGSIVPVSASRDIRINNKRIEGPSELRDGYLVSLGDLHAIFRFSTAYSPGYEPQEYLKPDSMPAQSAPTVTTCGWLVMQRGSLMGQDFRLVNGMNRIGSNVGLEVSIPDPHLVGLGFTLDCSSTKGCTVQSVQEGRALKVNGSVCEVGKVLRDSDVVSFDHLELLVKCF